MSVKSLTVLKSLALNQGWEQLVKVVEETEFFMQWYIIPQLGN